MTKEESRRRSERGEEAGSSSISQTDENAVSSKAIWQSFAVSPFPLLFSLGLVESRRVESGLSGLCWWSFGADPFVRGQQWRVTSNNWRAGEMSC